MKVFVSEQCPPCRELVKRLKKKGLEPNEDYELVMVEGEKEAKEHNVGILPTIIKKGKKMEGLPVDEEKIERFIFK